MNCDNGQITNDPELIQAWKQQGIPVLELPGDGYEQIFTTPAVVEEKPERSASEILTALGVEIKSAAKDAEKAADKRARDFSRRIQAEERERNRQWVERHVFNR